MLCLCWDTNRCTCQATFNSLLCIGKFEQMFGGELYILVSDIGIIRKPPPSHQYHFVGSCLRLSGRHIHAQTVSPTHTHIVAKFSTYLFTPLGQKTGLRVQPCPGWKVSSFFILTWPWICTTWNLFCTSVLTNYFVCTGNVFQENRISGNLLILFNNYISQCSVKLPELPPFWSKQPQKDRK